MSHPDLIIATQGSHALSPLTADELTVLGEALTEYQLRLPVASGRYVIADALSRRIVYKLRPV